MKRLMRSFSFRLAIAYAVLLSLSMALLFGLYHWVAVREPLQAVRAQVDVEAKALGQLYLARGRWALVAELDRRARAKSERRAFHTLIAGDGTVLTSNLPSWPRRSRADWFSIEADVNHEGDEQDHSAQVRDRTFADGTRLIVGRDVADLEYIEERLRTAAGWVLGATLILGLAGGAVMSRAIGGRLDTVSRAARRVMTGHLGERVAVRGSGDDFDRLSETLNLMLDHNERLFESVRRVSDNVAHELRTPLARLLVRLEALEGADAEPERRRVLREAALAETRRLHGIFDALLRIARIEGERHDAVWRESDISLLASDAAELYEPSAAARRVTLSVGAGDQIRAVADPDLLFQALSNLLDNALKHAPDGGRVEVAVEPAPGNRVMIAVSDNGQGLHPGEAERITERFFRGHGASGLPGEGLGLSLVDAIAALHRADLRFIDNRPGLRAELVLPRFGPDPEAPAGA